MFALINILICCRAYTFIFSVLFLTSAFSDTLNNDEILTIDKPVLSISELNFPDTEHIHPDKSDFKILSAILLSSISGKRSATITFKNLSSGQRILTNEDILAVFADGKKKQPLNFKQTFSGHETVSINLNFGTNRYPILSVYTKN